MKHSFLYLSFVLLLFACNKKPTPIKVAGESIGTFYNITYYDSNGMNFSEAIQGALDQVMQSCNIFDSTSTISLINSNKSNLLDDITKEILLRSFEISQKTEGNFDVTTGNLVNLWGFGPKNRTENEITQEEIDKTLQKVGYKKLLVQEHSLLKKNPETIIDFGAIAKGYAVDIVSRLLDSNGINSYLVEIGGEIYAKGVKPNGKKWTIGISIPDESNPYNQEFLAKIHLANKALATSGNYRNFYKVKEEKRVHTISPLAGRPVENELLSVTIIADDCMTADAFATAMMVVGLEKGKEIICKEKNLEAYFIYHEDDEIKTFATKGFSELISE